MDDSYHRFDHWACGNDLAALEKAKGRCREAMANPELPWFIRERAMELLGADSILAYEQIRVAWAELQGAIATRPPQ